MITGPKQYSPLDHERVKVEQFITVLPPEVRHSVESMYLAHVFGSTLLVIATATHACVLGECVAEAKAYAYAAYQYNEISAEEWRLLCGYVDMQAAGRRAALAREAESQPVGGGEVASLAWWNKLTEDERGYWIATAEVVVY